jgi:hypothetical protein
MNASLVVTHFLEAEVVNEKGERSSDLRIFAEEPSRDRSAIMVVFLADGGRAVYVRRFTLRFGPYQAFQDFRGGVPLIKTNSPAVMVRHLDNRDKILDYLLKGDWDSRPSVKIVIEGVSYK